MPDYCQCLSSQSHLPEAPQNRNHVYSLSKHLNQRWITFTVYRNTSWCQNLSHYLIRYEYWTFFFFLLIGKLVYMHWCVFIMYLLASVLLRLSLWWDSIYCIATYLPWYFGLALSAVIVRPWCRNHDLSDSPYPDPTSQLFTDPSSCLALSLPWIFLSIKCCMILTWPFECSQLTS